MPASCHECGLASTTACSACYTTFFCGPVCQRLAWPRHKPRCAPALVRAYLRAKGCTPLHACAVTSCTESLGLMLSLGIDPEVRCSKGQTALMTAALAGKAAALAVLLDGGASVSADWVTPGGGAGMRAVCFTALTCAIVHSGSEGPGAHARALACVQLLLARGATFSAEDAVVAAQFGAPEIVALVAAAHA